MNAPPIPTHQLSAVAILGVATTSIFIAGCRSPFQDRDHSYAHLRSSVDAAMAQEVGGLSDETPERTVTQPDAEVERWLNTRREELDALNPYGIADRTQFDVGTDLTGATQATATLSLTDAIHAAVSSNLALQSQRLQPAINEQDIINADAAFDWILFGSANYTKTDQPSIVPVIGGIPLGSPFNAAERHKYETGVRKKFQGGGTLTASTDLTRNHNLAPGISFAPDPAYTSAIRVGFDQPLLRGFGNDVNTATIHLAENARNRAAHQVHQQMLMLVSDVEQAYWDLSIAWNELAVAQWLVDEGEAIRTYFEGRRDLDTKDSQLADAVATVEQRKADVIRSRRKLRQQSDRLKLLLNHADMHIGSEVLLRPADTAGAPAMTYSLRDAVVTALQRRPEVSIAISNIDDMRLRAIVADNNQLPLLNFNAQLAWFGLEGNGVDAYEDLNHGDFVDSIIGLTFEVPIGNRGAEALAAQARLRQSASMVDYRKAVQGVINDVKSALRDVIANYELISATRSARIAAAENLRSLREEETLRGLPPEVLNLRFTKQNALAQARLEEIRATVRYDQAIASFHQAIGIGLDMHGIAIEITNDKGDPMPWTPSDAEHAATMP